MKAILVGIYDRGAVDAERVHLKLQVDTDLSKLVVIDTLYTAPNSISAGQRTAYWFLPHVAKAGENIVLYTRAGTYTAERREDGSLYKFFFRGLANALYARPDTAATLFEIDTWSTTKP